MNIDSPPPFFIPQNVSLTEITAWAQDNSHLILIGTVALGALACLCRPQATQVKKAPSAFAFFEDQPLPFGKFILTPLGMLKIAASASTTDSNVTIDSQATHLEIVVRGKPNERTIKNANRAITAWTAIHKLKQQGDSKTFNVTRSEREPFTLRIEIASSGELNASNLHNVSLYETKIAETASSAPTPSGTFVIKKTQLMPSGTFVVNPSGTVTASGIEAACASAGAGALTGVLVANITIDSQDAYLQIEVSGEPEDAEIQAAERAIKAWKARYRRALDVETEYKNTFKITGEEKDPYTFRIEKENQTNPLSSDERIEEKRKLDFVSLYETKGPGPLGHSIRGKARAGYSGMLQQALAHGAISRRTFKFLQKGGKLTS